MAISLVYTDEGDYIYYRIFGSQDNESQFEIRSGSRTRSVVRRYSWKSGLESMHEVLFE